MMVFPLPLLVRKLVFNDEFQTNGLQRGLTFWKALSNSRAMRACEIAAGLVVVARDRRRATVVRGSRWCAAVAASTSDRPRTFIARRDIDARRIRQGVCIASARRIPARAVPLASPSPASSTRLPIYP